MKVLQWFTGICLLGTLGVAQAEARPTPIWPVTWRPPAPTVHGTNGRAVQGARQRRTGRRPQGQAHAEAQGFRSGAKPATIMHQIRRATPRQPNSSRRTSPLKVSRGQDHAESTRHLNSWPGCPARMLPGLTGCAAGLAAPRPCGGEIGRRLRRRHGGWHTCACGATWVWSGRRAQPAVHLCPISNLVIWRRQDHGRHHAGLRRPAQHLGREAALRGHREVGLDAGAHQAHPASGGACSATTGWCCRRASSSCSTRPGLESEDARRGCFHAWKAGEQTWRCASSSRT